MRASRSNTRARAIWLIVALAAIIGCAAESSVSPLPSGNTSGNAGGPTAGPKVLHIRAMPSAEGDSIACAGPGVYWNPRVDTAAVPTSPTLGLPRAKVGSDGQQMCTHTDGDSSFLLITMPRMGTWSIYSDSVYSYLYVTASDTSSKDLKQGVFLIRRVNFTVSPVRINGPTWDFPIGFTLVNPIVPLTKNGAQLPGAVGDDSVSRSSAFALRVRDCALNQLSFLTIDSVVAKVKHILGPENRNGPGDTSPIKLRMTPESTFVHAPKGGYKITFACEELK